MRRRAKRRVTNRVGQFAYIADPFCSEDVIKFLENPICRTRLYPGQWNVWRLQISGDVNIDVHKDVREGIEFWFAKHGSVIPGVTLGAADNLEIFPIGDNSALAGKELLVSLLDPQFLCRPKPSVAKPVADKTVVVRFVYRGGGDRIPWPAYTSRMAQFYESWCPVGADIVLQDIYKPQSGDKIPAPSPDVLDKLADAAKVAGKEAAKGLGMGVVIVAAGAALVLAAKAGVFKMKKGNAT